MDYSFEPKTRYKEMKYYRYSLRKEELFEEKIYCRNELGFLRFLDDMNSKEMYSKFFSRIDREMHKEGRKVAMERNKGSKIEKETDGIENLIIQEQL